MNDESTLRDAGCCFDRNLEETVLNTEISFEEMEQGCFEEMICSKEKP